MQSVGERFKFFVPLEISKATNKEGKEVMRLGGIASTADRDSDGEILNPGGFDVNYFLKYGFINWHHQSKDNPASIIGEPTKAEKRPEGLYIETELYEDSDMAKKVYGLAKTLSKSKNRRLGFSIEGKVLEKDPLDETNITRARITGMAVTPTPKNANTFADIIKGIGHNDELEFETETKQEVNPNGGNTEVVEYMIDVIKPNGVRVTVDKDFNIKVHKAISTDNAGVLAPNDVEGMYKKKKDTEKKIEKSLVDNNNNNNFTSELNKSQIYSLVLSKYPGDLKKGKDAFNQIENIFNLNTEVMSKVTTPELLNALKTLKIDVNQEELEKAISDELNGGKKSVDLEKGDSLDELKKAYDEKSKEVSLIKAKMDEAEEKEKKKSPEDEEKEKALLLKKAEEDKKKKEEEEEEKEKALLLKKSNTDELNKDTQSDLVKGISAAIATSLAPVAETFSKGIDAINKVAEGMGDIEKRLAAIEDTPNKKSLVKAIDKDFLLKGDVKEDGSKVLSLTVHKGQIKELLRTKSGIEKGELNEMYTNALLGFEASNGTQLSKAVLNDLSTNDKITIIG